MAQFTEDANLPRFCDKRAPVTFLELFDENCADFSTLEVF